jgi:Fe-S cluster assembly ATP-binding protein
MVENLVSPIDCEPMTAPLLEIEGLRVAAEGVGQSGTGSLGASGGTGSLGVPGTATPGERGQIVRGVDLVVGAGEVHALMGPNGAGKSTLAATLMGHPSYRVVAGSIRFKGQDITHWATDARAKAGLFLAFQYPETIDGVSVVQFLRQAMSARRGQDVSALEVRVAMTEWMERLGMDPSFGERYLNQGFSGGEKKRNEILQMAMLEPELAVLDETDSGLDIDALGVVGRGVHTVRELHPALGVLVVTHYQRLLETLVPDRVHLLVDGRIVESGGPELAEKIERNGYESWRR